MANKLLQNCLNQRHVSLNRTLFASKVKNKFNAQLDKQVQDCLKKIFHITPSDDICVQYQPISPLNLGGMGICSNKLITNSPHVGSFALCLENVFQGL